jgi:pimeloyl-ACP methyl ester carboxylesterase
VKATRWILPWALACLPLMAFAAERIEPFRIQVSDARLADLQARLARTRWPDQILGSGWDYGVDVAYMKELVAHWQTRYDWRQFERRLNAFPQFTTELDGLRLHFLHVRSKHTNALPLILSHGWPGSVVEFHKVIPMLTEPEKHGGRVADAFHVVAPSLPGFGFSSAPREPGWSSQRMAEAFAKLMARLGYTRYGAQGGDWGGGITRWLAGSDGAHCIGGHSNFPGGNRPSDGSTGGATEAEIERFQKRNQELADHKAYGSIQGTRPLTLGYGLNDSPAGLAAWIVDKFWAWSDHGGNLLRIAAQPAAARFDDAVRGRRKTLSDGVCAVPQGNQRSPASLGRTKPGHQPDPLDGNAPGRAFRGAGTAAVARRRCPRVLPQGAVSENQA